MLKIGDVLVCFNPIHGLEYGKSYRVNQTRRSFDYEIGISGSTWWFGQIGSSEPWTNWFVLEKQWQRMEKLKELGI